MRKGKLQTTRAVHDAKSAAKFIGRRGLHRQGACRAQTVHKGKLQTTRALHDAKSAAKFVGSRGIHRQGACRAQTARTGKLRAKNIRAILSKVSTAAAACASACACTLLHKKAHAHTCTHICTHTGRRSHACNNKPAQYAHKPSKAQQTAPEAASL